VAPSTVSGALAKPGRVRFGSAERIRKVAEEIGYRSATLARAIPADHRLEDDEAIDVMHDLVVTNPRRAFKL
jgi:DNA-binding LacI/PurR family transcriptional regulator